MTDDHQRVMDQHPMKQQLHLLTANQTVLQINPDPGIMILNQPSCNFQHRNSKWEFYRWNVAIIVISFLWTDVTLGLIPFNLVTVCLLQVGNMTTVLASWSHVSAVCPDVFSLSLSLSLSLFFRFFSILLLLLCLFPEEEFSTTPSGERETERNIDDAIRKMKIGNEG